MNELLLPVLASGGAGTDRFFANVTLLLNGEGANGAQNISFIDTSNNLIPISRTGTIYQGSFSPFSKEPGDWAAYFTTSSSITWPSDITATGSQDFCCEAWVFLVGNAGQSYGLIFAGSNIFGAGGNAGNLQFSIANDGSMGMTMEGFPATSPNASAGTFKFNQWNHVVWCRTGTTCAIFYNGTRVSSGTSSYAATFRYLNGISSYQCQGYISNARIVVGSNPYPASSSTLTVPTQPHTAITNTKLLTVQDNYFIDRSSVPYTLTPTSVQITPFSPFTIPSSYQFISAANSSEFYVENQSSGISIADNVNLRMGTGNFTIEFWINFKSFTNFATIFEKGYTSSGGIIIQKDTGNGVLKIYNGGALLITASTAAVINTWNHVALVRNSGVTTLYLNGTSVGSNNDSTDYNNTGTLYVGGSPGGGGYYTNGYISNFRIVKGTAVYTGAFTPPTSPLTAITNTQLLACQDDFIKDSSLNNWTITNTGVSGSIINSIYSPFSGYSFDTTSGGSAYFDSTSTVALTNILQTSSTSALDISTGDFTVECWVYPTSVQNFSRVINFNSTYTTGSVGINYDQATGKIGWFGFDLASPKGGVASMSYVLNAWTHIALTRSGNTFRLFVDGVTANTTTYTTDLFATTTPYVTLMNGDVSVGGFSPLQGYISGVRIVKGTALYTADFTRPTAPPTKVTNTALLCNFTNAGVFDMSRTHNFETGGNAQIRTNIKKYNSSSIYFDGTGDYILSRRATTATSRMIPYLNNKDYTVEGWFYFTRTGQSGTTGLAQAIAIDGVGAYTNNNNDHNWIFLWGGSTVYFGKNPTYYTISFDFTLNTWYHIAVVGTSTNSITIYINGVSQGTQASRTALGTTSSYDFRLGIGRYGDFAGSDNYFQGYMDEFRITVGTQRYTANFTIPSGPFPGA